MCYVSGVAQQFAGWCECALKFFGMLPLLLLGVGLQGNPGAAAAAGKRRRSVLPHRYGLVAWFDCVYKGVAAHACFVMEYQMGRLQMLLLLSGMDALGTICGHVQ
jgi:hypothetical protein